MAKPPSQTLPPREGEGLGLGVKVVYSSDWYYFLYAYTRASPMPISVL